MIVQRKLVRAAVVAVRGSVAVSVASASASVDALEYDETPTVLLI